MRNRQTAVACMMLIAGILACNAPGSEADIDATVNARVAATLGAVIQEGDDDQAEATSAPSTQSVPDATHIPISGDGPSIDGCPIFPADHIWNTPVDALPVHPNSDAYIASI